MGVTLASFHKLETFPCAKEKLKRSQTGKDSAVATSLRSLLFIQSRPAALPVFKDLNIDSFSRGVVETELKVEAGVKIVGGREALLSSNVVCSVKKY